MPHFRAAMTPHDRIKPAQTHKQYLDRPDRYMLGKVIMSLLSVPRLLPWLFRPAVDALFTWNMPWRYRWRLLLLQPLYLIGFPASSSKWLFTRAYKVEYLRVSNRTFRVLVFKSPGDNNSNKRLRPLHVDIHGGAFMGGFPEDDAPFCDQLARSTGAVVISVSYRYAPCHVFPSAHDDIDALVRYFQDFAETKYGADPTLLTTSGFSAGGNLALSAAQAEGETCRFDAKKGIKAAVCFYPVCDLRLKPHEKPPLRVPMKDPMAWLAPLYDCYVEPIRKNNMENPRMNPVLADVDTLPGDIFVWSAGIDILFEEQKVFVERVREQFQRRQEKRRRVEMHVDDDAFHGYLNRQCQVVKQSS